MEQEQLVGILLCVIGLVLSIKPTLVWQLTERWKTEGGKTPSETYKTVLRIVSGTAIGIGVLLVAGILK